MSEGVGKNNIKVSVIAPVGPRDIGLSYIHCTVKRKPDADLQPKRLLKRDGLGDREERRRPNIPMIETSAH